jgi:outer membrane cobalamin receptor
MIRLARATLLSAAWALITVPVLTAQVPAELRGHLTDAATARPIADARIDVGGRTESTRSGADGEFVIRGLAPRDYVVHVRAFGYLPRDVDAEVVNARATTLDVALDLAPSTLASVVVRAARDTQALNAAVFDRRAIEASGRRDLGELLQTTPGVVITQAGGAGATSHVSIRGSGSNEVLVLVDGVPLNSAISGEADLSQIPLEAVERVTVRTGAQSARYGGRAMAGVIEVETRRPTNDASLLLRTGAWGEHEASAALGATRPTGSRRTSGSITADYRTVEGDFPYDVPAVRGGGSARRINSGMTSRETTGAISLDGDSSSSSLRGSWQESRRGMAGSIVQPSSTGRQDQSRRSAGLDTRWRHGWFGWNATGDVAHEGAAFQDRAPPFGTAYADTVNATATTASSSLDLGRGASSGSLGAEARGLDLGSTMLAPNAPHWQRLLGAWANARTAIDLGRDFNLGADAGARLDASSLIAGTVASPRIAATLSRGAAVASVSLGSGYAPPSLADQFFHEGVQVRANPGLEPERTRRDLEGRLGIHETNAGPFTLAGDVALYRSNIDGMILWQPDFQFIWSPSNFDVRRSGWELSGRSALRAAGLDVQGILNHTDVVYVGPVLTGQVAYRPRVTGSITAGLTRRAVRLETTTQYVGARRTVPGSPLNSLDPYWLTDAKVSRSMARRAWMIDAIAGVENLFDRPASMLVDYPFPGRTWTISLRLRRIGSRGE